MSSKDERERWNQKYLDKPEVWRTPDPFLAEAFAKYVKPLFPRGGSALDLAGGAGRHSIWLAERGWKVTLIDVSSTGVELARQNAGPLVSHIDCVLDDLTRLGASQTRFDLAEFDLVMAFYYLDRAIFPAILEALRPGGLLIYKTYTIERLNRPSGPKDPARLLAKDELPQLVSELEILHCREIAAEKATAELVARKK